MVSAIQSGAWGLRAACLGDVANGGVVSREVTVWGFVGRMVVNWGFIERGASDGNLLKG